MGFSWREKTQSRKEKVERESVICVRVRKREREK